MRVSTSKSKDETGVAVQDLKNAGYRKLMSYGVCKIGSDNRLCCWIEEGHGTTKAETESETETTTISS